MTPAESSETSGGGCGGSTTTYYYSSEATSTLTITNQNAEKSLLTFSYTVPSAGTLTIDGKAQTKASSFSKALDPNGTVLIKLTTGGVPGFKCQFESERLCRLCDVEQPQSDLSEP